MLKDIKRFLYKQISNSVLILGYKRMAKQKKTNKKVKRKKRKTMFTILELEDIYKVINKVQIQDKSVLCKIKDPSLFPVIENVIKDSALLSEIDLAHNKIRILPGEQKFGQNISFDQMEEEINEIFNN